ncbi:hypothetical protein F5J12DRAFT_907657 [Pisolithus orientalis]|uniref:uncharacterized protein n=1 Tax=Pisolithus orientalis TaxID=936130 RepID=UPI0022245D75|nr:uncharacterized protein F5J12DRAFT_907657 [Pisolithus orientalis]KAI5989186.1 hypothetical protein F5J12DRAFT_907657 [Pisolithus orientalis]
MPHPLREIAGDCLVYSVPIIVFIDDVSGNKLKQWNKHFSCYMSNGALSHEKLNQDFHVQFVATSLNVTPLEIMQGVHKAIEKAFDEPVASWDCQLKEEVLLQPFALFFAGDNTMQVDLSSSAGLNSNYFCQTCKVGRTHKHKHSEIGFSQILQEGVLWNSNVTAEHVFQQLMMALEPNIASALNDAVTGSGIKDMIAQPIIKHLVKLGQQLWKGSVDRLPLSPSDALTNLTEELKKIHTSSGGAVMNPLLNMPDTLTEILHIILLSIMKYYWAQTVWYLEKEKNIQSEYMCHYKGALSGKHFKTLVQVMSFLIFDLAWLVARRLMVLAWQTDIEDLDAYTV